VIPKRPDEEPKWASDGSDKGPMLWAIAGIAVLFLAAWLGDLAGVWNLPD
jgi:hypothetical protein